MDLSDAPWPVSAELLREFSPHEHLRRAGELPPLLVARAGADHPLPNESIGRFVAEALQRNIEIDLLNHPAGPHGFDLDDESSSAASGNSRVVADHHTAGTEPHPVSSGATWKPSPGVSHFSMLKSHVCAFAYVKMCRPCRSNSVAVFRGPPRPVRQLGETAARVAGTVNQRAESVSSARAASTWDSRTRISRGPHSQHRGRPRQACRRLRSPTSADAAGFSRRRRHRNRIRARRPRRPQPRGLPDRT
jgi:hypothetical protein